MNSEEKFKELLKEKLGTKEFPFNLANWEKAQEMIDASRSKKRRVVPFVFLCIGIFISGGLFFYFLNNTFLQPQTALVIKSTPPVTKQEIIENQTETATATAGTPSEYKKATVKEKSSKTEAVQPEKAAEKIIKNSPNVVKPARGNIVNPAPGRQRPGEVNESAKMIETNSIRAGMVMRRSNIKPVASVKNNESSSENHPSETDVIPVTRNPVATEEPTVKNEEEENKPGLTKTPEQKTDNTDVVVSAPEPIVTNPKPEVTNPKPEVTRPEPGTVNSESVITISEPALVTNRPEKNTVVPSGSKTDPAIPITKDVAGASADIQEADSAVTITKRQKRETQVPKNIFSVEAGFNYHAAWKNEDKKDANGVNPVIGLNYLRVITKKINVSLGLHYTTVGNLNNYSHTSQDSYYSFGRTSAMTVITPVKIHYLLAPLKFHYAVNEKNMIGFGYTFGYLLTVNDKVENYTQLLNSTVTTTNHSVTKTKGYSQGFNPYDSQLSVFYRRRLYNDLYANAEFFYGLVDTKDNSFFASNYFERNMGIKFTLIYNIFKK